MATPRHRGRRGSRNLQSSPGAARGGLRPVGGAAGTSSGPGAWPGRRPGLVGGAEHRCRVGKGAQVCGGGVGPGVCVLGVGDGGPRCARTGAGPRPRRNRPGSGSRNESFSCLHLLSHLALTSPAFPCPGATEQGPRLKGSSFSFPSGQPWAPGLPVCPVSSEVRMERQVIPGLPMGRRLIFCHVLQLSRSTVEHRENWINQRLPRLVF